MSNPVKRGTYQHIPSQVGRTQNLVGDYQRPPEIHDSAEPQDHRGENGNAIQNTNYDTQQILNQKWEDPPNMQPPMMPTNITTSQQLFSVQPSMLPNTSTTAMNQGVDAGKVVNSAMNHQNAEVLQQQRQGTNGAIDTIDESTSQSNWHNK